MGETTVAKLVILGSGPAGCAAAVYAARAMLEPVVIAGMQPGGQLTITTDVENYPGFQNVQGPELMVAMREHAEAMGAVFVDDHIANVELGQRPFVLQGDGGNEYRASMLILATGAQAKWLGLPSEERYKGHGVSACATCDGFFFRDKEVVVVGGGNTAVEEALFLTNFATKVYVVHRRDELRAEKILQQRLLGHAKVEMIWDHVLCEILGTEDPLAVTGVQLAHARTGEPREIACSGVFIAIGHSPATELVVDKLDTHMGGYVITAPDSTATSVPGVFAAGDVTDHIFRQAVTAAGMGCMAALEADRFWASNGES